MLRSWKNHKLLIRFWQKSFFPHSIDIYLSPFLSSFLLQILHGYSIHPLNKSEVFSSSVLFPSLLHGFMPKSLLFRFKKTCPTQLQLFDDRRMTRKNLLPTFLIFLIMAQKNLNAFNLLKTFPFHLYLNMFFYTTTTYSSKQVTLTFLFPYYFWYFLFLWSF